MTASSRLDASAHSRAADSYLPSASLDEYLAMVRTAHPGLYARLDGAKMRSADALAVLVATVNEFDSDATGRGDSYRHAQKDVSVRWTGARQLLRLATPAGSARDVTVLDVMGGDGMIARAVAGHADQSLAKLTILTGDISGTMVERALAMGVAAVRQAADFLVLRDSSVDAVLLAYGTHHIASADRGQATSEALRVTRRGGRVVIHDFDEASPMARFFAELVHPYSASGHDYRHFAREDMTALFQRLPAAVRVVDVYDPLVTRGRDPDAARRRMCEYVADMYGIHRVMGGELEGSWSLLEEFFDHSEYLAGTGGAPDALLRPAVRERPGYCLAEVPRMAIAAVAEKVR